MGPKEGEAYKMYTQTDMYYWNIAWYSARSIMVPYGYWATLFSGTSFTGELITVYGQMWNDPVRETMTCTNLAALGLADLTSSMYVGRFGDEPARGYWRSTTATGAFTFEISYGWSSSDTSSTTSFQQQSLTFSMKKGGFLFGSTKIAKSYANSITDSTT